jgi:hypothetical protein
MRTYVRHAHATTGNYDIITCKHTKKCYPQALTHRSVLHFSTCWVWALASTVINQGSASPIVDSRTPGMKSELRSRSVSSVLWSTVPTAVPGCKSSSCVGSIERSGSVPSEFTTDRSVNVHWGSFSSPKLMLKCTKPSSSYDPLMNARSP